MSEHQHDENCNHDHEHDEEPVFLVTDESGQEHEMMMVFSFETSGQTYAVLLDKNDAEADGMIFRVEEEDGEAFLVNVEDDEEWERVVAVYEKLAAEENAK